MERLSRVLGYTCRSGPKTLMVNNLAASIEKWFVDQDDEFVIYGSDFQSFRYGSVATAEILVYTTKYHALTRVARRLFGTDVAILDDLGCQGRKMYKQWMQKQGGLFFSAMLTLLICSHSLGFERIRPSNFLGVNDQFLQTTSPVLWI